MKIESGMRYPLPPVRKAITKKTRDSAGQDEDKRKPLYTVGGDVTWFKHYGKAIEVTQKLKTELPYAPAVLLSGVHLKEVKTGY